MIAIRNRITLLSVAALALTGCAGAGGSASSSPGRSTPAGSGRSAAPGPHTLVFSVTGKGHVASITYVIDGRKATERSVELPWRKTVQVPPRAGGHTWDLRTHHARGTSTAVVYVDGAAYGGGTCSGADCEGGSSGSIAG
ncbi:hypothetical protein [Actinoallomurus iriomotensis]|uniref:Secreted protein n=1 Tax=Actinoallomurus iriomotensis TaxID=478107 RepID=A0A9W6VRT6_9ACTN|nr:hypothetical protein [Actinoallomurus iriomotensis]GLY77319.1 hypothetical protein Airi01_055860 [Actinoallomurus iriomotensis]